MAITSLSAFPIHLYILHPTPPLTFQNIKLHDSFWFMNKHSTVSKDSMQRTYCKDKLNWRIEGFSVCWAWFELFFIDVDVGKSQWTDIFERRWEALKQQRNISKTKVTASSYWRWTNSFYVVLIFQISFLQALQEFQYQDLHLF